MKVLFLNPQGNFDPKDSYWTSHPDFGGQLVYVKEIAAAMAKMGVEADIVTRRMEDPKWPEFSSVIDGYDGIENLRIVRIDFGGKRFLEKERLWPHLREYVAGIRKFYSEEGGTPDFATTHYGDGGISGALLFEETGMPYSFTAHSLGAQKMDKLGVDEGNFAYFDGKYRFSSRITAERTAMKYSAFNVVSTDMERREQYAHRLYRGAIDTEDAKFKVIPPGVNPAVFNANESESDDRILERMTRVLKRYTDPQRYLLPSIVLSSRIDPKKNHLSALKAYASSEYLKENANFVIVVRGMENVYSEYVRLPAHERGVMEEIVALVRNEKLEDRVFFFNADGQSELASLYRVLARTGSIFSNPALYEPFGLSIVEAMACGLPVAATKNGGPSEILGERGSVCGLLFDPENTEEISGSFERLISEEKTYSEIKKAGAERVFSKYTWEAAARGYLGAIREAVGNEFEKPEIPDFEGGKIRL